MTIKKKALRILITPNVDAPYDQRMVKGFAAGFNAIGHYAGALSAPLPPDEIAKLCENLSIDVVLQINRTRDPETPLPPNVRHIAWYQDVYPETLDGFSECFRESDILYSLGDPKVLGLKVQMPCFTGYLFTGVDQATLEFNRHGFVQNLDFSLCGGLPPPVHLVPNLRTDLLWFIDGILGRSRLLGRARAPWALRKIMFSRRLPVNYVPYATLVALAQIVESFYRPLRGELDIHALANAMYNQASLFGETFPVFPPPPASSHPNLLSRILRPYTGRFRGRSDLKARLIRLLAGETMFLKTPTIAPIKGAISYFSQSYPRIMDRMALVEAALQVSSSLELYGPGLAAYEFARPWLKGVLESREALLEVYCRSKINLNNNTHGLGLHSRTLECMAVGGFIFMHESPHDSKVGGMLTSFDPGVHYGSYAPETFPEEARRWLLDDQGRKQAAMRAQSVIRQRHCWHHRAQQVIEDLNR